MLQGDHRGSAGAGVQRAADIAVQLPARLERYECDHGRFGESKERQMRPGFEQTLLDGLDARHQLGQKADAAGQVAQSLGAGAQFPQLQFAAVQAVVDVHVDVAADEAADGNGEHREQRHVAVGGADAEIRVIQDAHGSGDPEHHVEAEPTRRRAEEAEPRPALAQRIHQQQQHQAPADDAEPVTHAAIGADVARSLGVPAEV